MTPRVVRAYVRWIFYRLRMRALAETKGEG